MSPPQALDAQRVECLVAALLCLGRRAAGWLGDASISRRLSALLCRGPRALLCRAAATSQRMSPAWRGGVLPRTATFPSSPRAPRLPAPGRGAAFRRGLEVTLESRDELRRWRHSEEAQQAVAGVGAEHAEVLRQQVEELLALGEADGVTLDDMHSIVDAQVVIYMVCCDKHGMSAEQCVEMTQLLKEVDDSLGGLHSGGIGRWMDVICDAL